MADESLATVVYGSEGLACIYGDTADARVAMRSTAEAAGLRVTEMCGLAPVGPPSGSQAMPALVELTAAADRAAARALLDRLQREADARDRPFLVSAPIELIDLVWDRAPDARLLCDAVEPLRIVEVARAARPLAPRLDDARRAAGPAILQQLTEDVSRIAAILSSLSEEEAAAIAAASPPPEDPGGETGVDAPYIRAMLRARRLRDHYFRSELFADPAWDMLLDLLAARLEGKRVAVSSLCIAAAVPATTALRWIKALTDRGLFVRAADPHDGRRVHVELSDEAARSLTACLGAARRIAPAWI